MTTPFDMSAFVDQIVAQAEAAAKAITEHTEQVLEVNRQAALSAANISRGLPWTVPSLPPAPVREDQDLLKRINSDPELKRKVLALIQGAVAPVPAGTGGGE